MLNIRGVVQGTEVLPRQAPESGNPADYDPNKREIKAKGEVASPQGMQEPLTSRPGEYRGKIRQHWVKVHDAEGNK